MWPEAPASTMNYHPRQIELHVFVPEADGAYRSTLYEDDGLSFAFKRGASYRTDFTLTRAGAHLTLEATVTGDGYPEFARESFRVVFHGPAPAHVQVGGRRVELQGDSLVLPNAGEAFVLEAAME